MATAPHAAIAEQAYFLWLNDGMRHGKAEHHWAMAEKLLAPTVPVATPLKTKKTAPRIAKSAARSAKARNGAHSLHS